MEDIIKNLHSTIFRLKLLKKRIKIKQKINLHSTIFRLKQGKPQQ